MEDSASASATEATASSADEEGSFAGDITIHLPGLPVTADCPLTETDEDELENPYGWSGMENSDFHGFTSAEIEAQRKNNERKRYRAYSSCIVGNIGLYSPPPII